MTKKYKMDFTNLAILVIGDVMLDHYISGSVERVSPEAPVPVVTKEKVWTVPGGAANVVRGLAGLGCHVRLVGFAAEDAAGVVLRQEIASENIEAALISGKNRPTSCKTRIISQGQQLLRIDEEIKAIPSFEERKALLKCVETFLPGSHAVILSDYGKGVLLRDRNGQSICADVIKQANLQNIPVLVDPKGTDWERYERAACVTPNMKEFEQISPTLNPAYLMEQKANQICHKYNFEHLLVTQSSKGMTLFDKDGSHKRIKATAREVSDVSGAGDTVIAVLTACVAKGLTWGESANIANLAAGVAVGKLGTAPVTLGELNQVISGDGFESKLFSQKEIAELTSEWHKMGKRIVFTNGCFDLLHPGHVTLLHKCSEMGDKLIVGLNSDLSVQRLKGPSRPIQTERNRALVLAALQDIDGVVIFEEDTPKNLIELIKPDVLVKGSDYTQEQVVGADFVKSYGGRVCLVDLVPDCSTTGLVNHVKEIPK